MNIPREAIEAGAKALVEEAAQDGIERMSDDPPQSLEVLRLRLIEAVLRVALPHVVGGLVSENDRLWTSIVDCMQHPQDTCAGEAEARRAVGRYRSTLKRITEMAERSDAHPDCQIALIARKALKPFTEPPKEQRA